MTITDFDVAIVNGDSHMSRWVCEHRRLDVQREFCLKLAPYIPKGGVVIDVGACLGDHTVVYAEMVGLTGHVLAFEPNPLAFECLHYNMRNLRNVTIYDYALNYRRTSGHVQSSSVEPDNLGASMVIEDLPSSHNNVQMITLDSVTKEFPRLDFIKIDAEGSEPNILAGALATMCRLRPVMLIEVNRPVLAARGKTAEDIFALLRAARYRVVPSEPHLSLNQTTLDILALPL